MKLRGKVAIIYGGGGAIGSAVARAWAAEGAKVHLVGRNTEKLGAAAHFIRVAGGEAQTAVVDALDMAAVQAHADAVARSEGGIDLTLNAVGIMHVQTVLLKDLSLDDYFHPVEVYTRTNFIPPRPAPRIDARAGWC